MPGPTAEDLDDEDVYFEGGSYFKECHECGGNMDWCSTCDTWTRTCCVDYGTCMCS